MPDTGYWGSLRILLLRRLDYSTTIGAELGCELTCAAQARKSPVVNARIRRCTVGESFGM